MPRMRMVALTVLVLVGVTSSSNRASAQEVRWRHDYTAARREATETGRPLLLDFGTEACVWCRKLDGTTFRDPKVVKLLNERFIPVKIDASKEERLTAALGIDGFPTLVLATADGKVVGRHAGYGDAAQITALLNKAPAPAPTAMATAPRSDSVPARPVMEDSNESEAEKLRRAKAQIDADLAALYPKIVAALDR